MAITLNGTTGISSPGGDTSTSLATTNLSYTGTLTGGTGVIAIGTNQIYKDASGNVGIGTASPGSKLHLTGSNVQFRMTNAAGTPTTRHIALVDSDNTWRFTRTGIADDLTIDNSGNLGIGTSSPAANVKLSVNGTIQIATGTTSSPGCIFTNANFGMLFQAYQASPALADFSWLNSAGTERARITSAGDLLVGTTSSLYGTGATISTSTRASSCQFNLQAANGAGYDTAIYMECPGSFGATIQTQRSSGMLRIWNGAGTAGVTLASAGTSWGTFSDERLKDIIEPIENALAKVNGLRAVIAKYKSDTNDKRRSVLIAQDVEAVLPEAVYDDRSEEKYLSVAYTDTIPLLVAAIKELTTRLEALEAQ